MRTCQIIAVVALLGIETQAARRGYLCTIGPAPLRFEAVSDASSRATLPPLAMNDNPATNVVQMAAVAPTPSPVPAAKPGPPPHAQVTADAPADNGPGAPALQPLEPQLLDLGPAPTNANPGQMPWPQATFTLPATPPPASMVSPQMLVPFFIQNQSTNNSRITTVVPIMFAPPVPNQPLSSSATYLTPLDGTRGDPVP